jgi:nitrogen fixation/metabolism regulation signal transduction histidine kinase
VRKLLLKAATIAVLMVLVALVVWQGSFRTPFERTSTEQTYLLWAVSSLLFVLTVALGFMLVRDGVKLYFARKANREGSRIRTKLILGALALSVIPVGFLLSFSISVLNYNIQRMFLGPTESMLHNLTSVSREFDAETARRVEAQARWLAANPVLGAYLNTGIRSADLPKLCTDHKIREIVLERRDSGPDLVCSGTVPGEKPEGAKLVIGRAELDEATVLVRAPMPVDLAEMQKSIEGDMRQYHQLSAGRAEIRSFYVRLQVLISLFILFVATWIARTLADQISRPITALVEAAGELRKGNLEHRIQTPAMDELATLVRAFNEMTSDLRTNERELERRRQFTEAILESIPSGVISLSPERGLQRVNSALTQMLGAERTSRARRLEDLFPPEHVKELNYLLNRARRTGIASGQIDLEIDRRVLHLSVTVSPVGGHAAGWVVVLEDSSELLRAQKAAAWHEVARRIAHELKNPLTPISLSAERIARQLERAPAGSIPPDTLRILRECSLIISGEVESVKQLADEFSQLARFPAAQRAPADLNEVVEAGLAVFTGRLDGIEIVRDLARDLPPVSIDREQIKRVVVNLVDNAAEAMGDRPLRRLYIATGAAGADTVELVVADTGPGVSPEDRERLFLPYFSTKQRGTGLGLAIVHHILGDHDAQIRVEENKPCGARFVVELGVAQPAELAAEAAA